MKRYIGWAIALGALVLVSWWGYRTLFPQDEVVIRRVLQELAQIASVRAQEAPLARLLNSTKLTGYFTPDVAVDLDRPVRFAHDIRGRTNLLELVAAARTQVQQARVRFVDVKPVVSADRQSAVVELTALIDVDAEENVGIQELRLTLVKRHGDWLIKRVETVRVLGR